MKYPHLYIYLDAENNLCFAKIQNEGDVPRLIVDVSLEDVQALTTEELQQKVGGTVIGLLKLWHGNILPSSENLWKGKS